jgi:hypothetical protein
MLVNYFKDRQGSHFRALDAILYAVRNGADVVNCSYVTTSLLGMEAVFQEAYEAGVPIVAAAGPGKKDLADFPQFPAGLILPGVISVGASNSADTLGNSNFGKKHVDIFAPGVSTSLATPLVSSTVALLKALKPDATLEELVAAVIEGAEPVDALSDLCVSGGRLDVSGSARALLGKRSGRILIRLKYPLHSQVCAKSESILQFLIGNPLMSTARLILLIGKIMRPGRRYPWKWICMLCVSVTCRVERHTSFAFAVGQEQLGQSGKLFPQAYPDRSTHGRLSVTIRS